MSLQLQTQRAFERDAKKMKRRNKDLSKLKEILEILVSGKNLPNKYRNHKLTGNYRGYWECHIEPDWLLIYKKTSSIIILERTGSHADLF